MTEYKVLITNNSEKEDNKINWTEIIKHSIIPILIAIVTVIYTSIDKNREIDMKYLELAINILKQKDTNSNTHLKNYANNIIEKFSPIPYTKEVSDEMKKFNLSYSIIKSDGFSVSFQKKDKNNKWYDTGYGFCTNNLFSTTPIPSNNFRWKLDSHNDYIIDKDNFTQIKAMKLFIDNENNPSYFEDLNSFSQLQELKRTMFPNTIR